MSDDSRTVASSGRSRVAPGAVLICRCAGVSAGGERAWIGAVVSTTVGSMRPDGPSDQQGQLTDLYAAFNRRDIPALLAAMAPDVVWPNGWEGGTLRGRDEVRDYWTRQWGQIVPTVIPTGFSSESDGRIAVTVQQVVRDKAGTIIADGTVTHVYRFVDGLVTEMEILERRDGGRVTE